jgi:hypothetical protein
VISGLLEHFGANSRKEKLLESPPRNPTAPGEC